MNEGFEAFQPSSYRDHEKDIEDEDSVPGTEEVQLHVRRRPSQTRTQPRVRTPTLPQTKKFKFPNRKDHSGKGKNPSQKITHFGTILKPFNKKPP